MNAGILSRRHVPAAWSPAACTVPAARSVIAFTGAAGIIAGGISTSTGNPRLHDAINQYNDTVETTPPRPQSRRLPPETVHEDGGDWTPGCPGIRGWDPLAYPRKVGDGPQVTVNVVRDS